MSLTDFNTARGDINDLILAATREINFRGVSVSHTFSKLCVLLAISKRHFQLLSTQLMHVLVHETST